MKINDLPMMFRRRVYGAVTVMLKMICTWIFWIFFDSL